ncbi:LacI family DNA-binding transcriptional regulator [Plantibacter sp. YIM 135249]|uniref:LacI family DNA-binding transcriptional regulator n=1 Tax=Plantibacter sp. YIM 135249 TaxID=3423918 RepID=UPI003D3421DE
MVTMYDVARAAGLSIGTVSRFVNGNGYVSAASEEAIRAAIAATGYVPNNAARSLTTKRSGLIGFITSDLINPFTALLAQSMALRASESGHSVLTAVTDGDEARALEVITALRGQQVDGLVVTPPESAAVNAYLETITGSGTPVVLVGMELDTPADRVSSDTYGGAKAAVEHLLRLGHTRIAFVSRAPAESFARGRYRGYCDALAEHGITVDPQLVFGLDDTASALGDATGLALERATAVFAVNDLVALGVAQEAHRRGRRVPEDLSVVGFDDIALAGVSSPPLTTVRQPTEEMGQSVIDLLLARLADPSIPASATRHDCSLVVRGSTAPPRP